MSDYITFIYVFRLEFDFYHYFTGINIYLFTFDWVANYNVFD